MDGKDNNTASDQLRNSEGVIDCDCESNTYINIILTRSVQFPSMVKLHVYVEL